MIFGEAPECHAALNGLLADTGAAAGGQFGNYVLKTILAQVTVAMQQCGRRMDGKDATDATDATAVSSGP